MNPRIAMEEQPFLNIGCGDVFHPAWSNIDLHPAAPSVRKHDVRKGIPYPSGTFRAVYHSHVLEHMTPKNGHELLKECARVLAPGGILRIVVPDLERICQIYLEKLDVAISGEGAAEHDYDWIMLELYDQAVRTCSGGEMAKYLSSQDLPNESFIRERIGDTLLDAIRAPKCVNTVNGESSRTLCSFLRSAIRRMPSRIQRLILQLALGAEGGNTLDEIRFRQSGEIHRWMYDRFSITRLMEKSGFVDTSIVDAFTSGISFFREWALDEKDGVVRKPDSIFVEGQKPPGFG